jgi:hypothetical protein
MAGDASDSQLSGTEKRTMRASVEEEEPQKSTGNPVKRQSWLPNWAIDLGAVCGLVVAILTIGKFGWDVFMYFSSSPKLSLVDGPALELSYLPQQHRVDVVFPFAIQNEGERPNIVSALTASIVDRADPSKRVAVFTSTDFKCKTGQAKVSIPFTVANGLPASMECLASAYVPESGRGIFVNDNSKQFVLSAAGQKKTTSALSYCFDVPDYFSNGIRNGQSKVDVKFIAPYCE